MIASINALASSARLSLVSSSGVFDSVGESVRAIVRDDGFGQWDFDSNWSLDFKAAEPKDIWNSSMMFMAIVMQRRENEKGERMDCFMPLDTKVSSQRVARISLRHAPTVR